MRVWVIYYSQTGDTASVARAISEPFQEAGHLVELEAIRLEHDYPYPWRSPWRFFSVLPECLLGPAPSTSEPLLKDPETVDLIILVYQVWFLSPSLPIQGFLASPCAQQLRGRKIITVSVSRNMWISASERMKQLLQVLGVIHLDQIAVTHQGPPWATFITTPRALLFGRREAFWCFPPAGIDQQSLDRVRHLSRLACELWMSRTPSDNAPLLAGAGAVDINRRYLIPETIGWYLFTAWAHVLKWLGRWGTVPKSLGILGFILFLVSALVIGIPLVWLITLVLAPFLKRPMDAYIRRLAEPSGTAVAQE